jgi:predicted Fe-Mo cluster-binding NifX family protein
MTARPRRLPVTVLVDSPGGGTMLAERGVKCIVAGGTGPRAQALFDAHQIGIIVGVCGTVAEAAEALGRFSAVTRMEPA